MPSLLRQMNVLATVVRMGIEGECGLWCAVLGRFVGICRMTSSTAPFEGNSSEEPRWGRWRESHHLFTASDRVQA